MVIGCYGRREEKYCWMDVNIDLDDFSFTFIVLE